MPLFRKHTPMSHERTAQEREQERLERARRRAEREGRPLDEPPVPTGGAGDVEAADGPEHAEDAGHPDRAGDVEAADGPEHAEDAGHPDRAADEAHADETDRAGELGGAGGGGHAVDPDDLDDPPEAVIGGSPLHHAEPEPALEPPEPARGTERVRVRRAGESWPEEPPHQPEGRGSGWPGNGSDTGSHPSAMHSTQETIAWSAQDHSDAQDPLRNQRPEPALDDADLAPLPLPPVPVGERLPPPPNRRDALLERRARRLRRQRAAGRQGPRGGGPLITARRIAALLVVAVVAFAAWFLVSLFQPFAGSGHGQVAVDIPHGASASKIGSILANDKVVSSGFFFNLRAALSGKRGALHSGHFVLQRDMSYSAAISALTKPPPTVLTVKVVVPEGAARVTIDQIARVDGLTGNYLAASVRSPALNIRRYGAPRSTPNLEGFLFPATYQLRAGAAATALVAQQVTAFRRNFGPATIRAARARRETPYRLLIVASMIEREAAVARDRPLIAAVIYNRLRDHTPLGIDATIRYALNDFSRPLTVSQLSIPSPYNTRTHLGLPPTPIGNPGLASIQAAVHPAAAAYLYYVAGADGCGEHAFSTSYTQFQRDVAAYQAAVRRNGGRVPTCRKKA